MRTSNYFTSSLLSLLACTLLVVGACSKKINNANEIRFRLPGDPPSIDWSLATDNVSKEVIVNLMEGLLEPDENAHIKPAMAESWSLSPDGKTYTFKLRNGIVWSDGVKLTASHFVDSWERQLNAKTASEYAYFLFDIVGAEDYQKGTLKDFAQVGVKAIDELTLEVKLRNPVAYWLNIPTFWVTYPIRKDVVAKYGDKWTDPANIVTAGAYKLISYERDSKIVLEKNPTYYRKEFLDQMPPRIVFRVVKDDATAVALYKNHDLDIVRDLPPIQIPDLSKRPDFVVSPLLRGFYIGFSFKDPQTADPKIRLALAQAIDRSQLKNLINAFGTPSKTWNQPTLIGYDPNIGVDFNPASAKKIFSELKNKPTTIELWYDQKELNRIVVENLQAQWKNNLGIDVKLLNQEWKVYLKTLQTKTPPIYRLGWGADYPDPDTFMALFTCGSGNNMGGFCNKKYDALIHQAGATTKTEERAKAYAEAEKLLLEQDVAILPLFSQTNLHLVSERISGFKVNPMGDFSMKSLKIKTGGAR